jgi:hypothetical protein
MYKGGTMVKSQRETTLVSLMGTYVSTYNQTERMSDEEIAIFMKIVTSFKWDKDIPVEVRCESVFFGDNIY